MYKRPFSMQHNISHRSQEPGHGCPGWEQGGTQLCLPLHTSARAGPLTPPCLAATECMEGSSSHQQVACVMPQDTWVNLKPKLLESCSWKAPLAQSPFHEEGKQGGGREGPILSSQESGTTASAWAPPHPGMSFSSRQQKLFPKQVALEGPMCPFDVTRAC